MMQQRPETKGAIAETSTPNCHYRPTGRQNGSRDAELKRVCGWLSAELI